LGISLIALFVALGGTTCAATNLPKNSVGAKQLKNAAVTPPKVARKTIALFKVRPGRRLRDGAGTILDFCVGGINTTVADNAITAIEVGMATP
jgi:hypothetical protein